MQRFFKATVLVVAIAIVATTSRPARADAPPKAQAVLATEARWLTAIVAGDRTTIDAILSRDPEFAHITADGKLIYRAEELASTKKESFTMKATEQTVDFAGDVAIVRGLNTVTQRDRSVERVRFTDVFIDRNGRWQAISAQESPIGGGPRS